MEDSTFHQAKSGKSKSQGIGVVAFGLGLDATLPPTGSLLVKQATVMDDSSATEV